MVFQKVKRKSGGRTEEALHAVAPPVLAHFLEDLASGGAYKGFPALGIRQVVLNV